MHPIPANEALNNEPLYYSYLSFLFRFIPRLSSFSKLQTSLGEILSAPAILAVFLFLRKRQMFSKKIINLSPPHLKFFEEIPRFLSHLVKKESWEKKGKESSQWIQVKKYESPSFNLFCPWKYISLPCFSVHLAAGIWVFDTSWTPARWSNCAICIRLACVAGPAQHKLFPPRQNVRYTS